MIGFMFSTANKYILIFDKHHQYNTVREASNVQRIESHNSIRSLYKVIDVSPVCFI